MPHPYRLHTQQKSERIEQAVQAIMDFNNYSATELNQKWAITSPAVMRLSGCGRASVKRFLQKHHLATGSEIEIPTLAPVPLVLTAIEHLQTGLGIKLGSLPHLPSHYSLSAAFSLTPGKH